MNWNQNNLFNRERFEAWLSVQPDAREFDYCDNTGCAGCCFIKETTGAYLRSMSSGTVYIGEWKQIGIPDWLFYLLRMARNITGVHRNIFIASELKRAYAQMFPEQEISVPINQQTSVKTNQTKD